MAGAAVMRWAAYLVACLAMEVLAVVLAPFLPAFAAPRLGWSDNHSRAAIGLRLPLWLAWFDTPDNSLDGDEGHRARCAYWDTYAGRVVWLLRNRAYGFKWGPLAARMDRGRIIEGDIHINRNTGRFGVLRITMGDYWQFKAVKPIGTSGWCYMLNFGWLLDDASQERALFLFSPRIARIHSV